MIKFYVAYIISFLVALGITVFMGKAFSFPGMSPPDGIELPTPLHRWTCSEMVEYTHHGSIKLHGAICIDERGEVRYIEDRKRGDDEL